MNFLRDRCVSGFTRRRQVALLLRTSILSLCVGQYVFAADEPPINAILRQYCFGCHGKAAMGGINLEKLVANPSVGENFVHWEKVIGALEAKQMPPAKMKQPADDQRALVLTWVKAQLDDYARKHAGDPGKVTVRRLTSGEYAYTIKDLTGLDLRFDDFVADQVGGEGFTNFGDVQFVDDSNLERYLESAKRVAAHAVIGSGPLGFYDDAGKSGFELSAVKRIQDIYHANGFRSVAAEGATPYGLDLYQKAFFAAWRYQHRVALGEPKATVASIAKAEGVSPKFVEHLRTVVADSAAAFPTSEVITKFRALPVPTAENKDKAIAEAREKSAQIQNFVIDWPRWLFAAGELAKGGQGDERALMLSDSSVNATATGQFRHFQRLEKGATKAKFHINLASANSGFAGKPATIWSKAVVRVRKADRSAGPSVPLATVLTEESLKKLNWTRSSEEFKLDESISLEFTPPEKALFVEVSLEAKLAPGQADNAVLRCVVAETEDLKKGRPAWALLADPNSPGFKEWKSSVLKFAANLPQNSQGEPTPADRDPIPAPYNNTYNQPERDKFHQTLKYYRTDDFFVRNMIDADTRKRLDQAWIDLLSSFEYHDMFLQFIAGKYKVNIGKKGMGDLTPAEIAVMPAEAQKYIKPLRAEYVAMNAALKTAEPGHVEDVLKLASAAWRKPLAETEKARLRAFYASARRDQGLDHDKAVRALLARVLVAPAFLYRLEHMPQVTGIKALNNWELASRLSYFLWSSAPDAELRRAAAAGELSDAKQLERQTKRMLADPKARRFSTEFFGQWLGFYRFDQHRGVDTTRFPEFNDEVKQSMYDEAVSFFEHVVRKDRPVRDLLYADYAFLNKALAKHYGIKKEITSTDVQLVDGTPELKRGGMLRLGAVLTATSAPLRTSPVKRGDWVLRRVLGTPTPPPPPDAGSIPADEKNFGGLSLKEKLLAHQRNATCAGCHTRIDPLGFPLERYDAVGRYRETYSDGKPVEDATAMADKTELKGVDGLLDYLKTREKQVMKNFSAKLLGYALGRTVQASDQLLIAQMTKSGYDTNLSKLVTDIVTSKQFRYRRESDDPAPASNTQHTQRRPDMALPERQKEGGL